MGKFGPYMAAVVAVGFLLSAMPMAAADSRADKLNQNTIGLMAADPQWLPQATAIAAAVQHEQGLRILPILGAGTLQAVSDLAYLERVDAALVPLDTLTYAQAQGLLDGLGGKVTYVARLQPVTWALVVPAKVDGLQALQGKRIATGPTGSMGFVAGELLFNALEVSFSRVPRQNNEALTVLTQGAADAALVDASILRHARIDGKRYKVLPLAQPRQLDSTYVETVAAPLAIMVFNKGQDKLADARIKAFTTALMRNANRLKINANLAAEIPGWTRHRAAQAALNQLAAESVAGSDTALQQGDGQ
jgi:ABC-type amino acid transport substrate-binding protein